MLLRAAVFSLALVSSLGLTLFSGCEGDSQGEGGRVAGLDDVLYDGGATDEALEALLAQQPKDDPEKAATITWPANNEQLTRAEPPTFWWEVGPTARRLAPSDLRIGQQRAPIPKHPLSWLLSRVPSAHAHGTPVNGPAYLLVISSDDDPELVRVFTTASEYQLPESAWTKVKDATGPLTAKVVWADFETNRVIDGPWDGPVKTFGVQAE